MRPCTFFPTHLRGLLSSFSTSSTPLHFPPLSSPFSILLYSVDVSGLVLPGLVWLSPKFCLGMNPGHSFERDCDYIDSRYKYLDQYNLGGTKSHDQYVTSFSVRITTAAVPFSVYGFFRFFFVTRSQRHHRFWFSFFPSPSPPFAVCGQVSH